MIGRGSHDVLTKSMFPWMEENFIHQINTIIDNPSKQQKKVQDSLRNSSIGFNPVEQNFGIWSKKGNHRQYNHNLMAGAMIAAQYGPAGWNAFVAHMSQDLMSDMVRDSMGYHGRNLWEASMMYNIHGARNLYKRRKELQPFMPIPSPGMIPAHKSNRKHFSRRVYPRYHR